MKKKYTDTDLLNALEHAEKKGACPGLIADDAGRWAVADDGLQPLPGKIPMTMNTTFFVDKRQWKNSIRKAIVYWINYKE